MRRPCRALLLLSALLAADGPGPRPVAAQPAATAPAALSWPAATREQRPWTRWWWLGSAVDKTNLTRQLTQFAQAGLGGVEICPIYGVRGQEQRHIEFLSPRWLDMLAHTTAEAKRLGLGVDLTTGTGWPFGGPIVTPDIASARLHLQRYDLTGGDRLPTNLPPGRLQAALAFSETGQRLDLTERLAAGRAAADWPAPPGQWRLYVATLQSPIQQVKRAAPGGEGHVLDPFSVRALDRYLAWFDEAFAGYRGDPPRAHFHDSFEYYGAQWTADFFAQFAARRGYDLRDQLPALFGEGPADTVARVKADYRATISDLHLAYVRRWTEWCHAHGSRSRNQAHGSPGNLLDHYAAADIPETEIFGGADEAFLPMNQFASSAAHLTGRVLTSAESFTWLGEHFQTSLAEVKRAADLLFLAGVNHLFFHGIPYSPADAPWPGWQFYASVNFGPHGGLWRDLPSFNAYVTRCQSILQSGQPANDVLLYFPFQDLWHTTEGLTFLFAAPGRWMQGQAAYDAAMTLWRRGYAYDFVTDSFLAQATVADGRVRLGETSWAAVVLPRMRFLPVATLRKLGQLAREGATLLVQGDWPNDVPGFVDLEQRRAERRAAIDAVPFDPGANGTLRRATVGQGRVLAGDDLPTLLTEAGVRREPCVDAGIHFVRRTRAGGFHYFLANRSDQAVDGWVTLGTAARGAVFLDPRQESRAGVAALRSRGGATQVYLQLAPGESCVLRTWTNQVVAGPAWPYVEPSGEPHALSGVWDVRFVEGGPELPANFQTRELASWTTRGAEAERFHGTARYRLEFDRPAGEADDWWLDLGRVGESARVRLNGHDLGTLWSEPFRLTAGEQLLPGRNTLEIEVTNLAANRIRDLDRRQVTWKYFYDINVVNKRYRPLDASDWPLRDSGLLGPVSLTPLRRLQPGE